MGGTSLTKKQLLFILNPPLVHRILPFSVSLAIPAPAAEFIVPSPASQVLQGDMRGDVEQSLIEGACRSGVEEEMEAQFLRLQIRMSS